MIYVSSRYFPSLKRGHSRKIVTDKYGNPKIRCGRCGEFNPKVCWQDPGKLALKYLENEGKPEHFSPLKKAKDEGFVGGSLSMMRGSAVVLPFARNEHARITIPALNLKFGARKEYPSGYTGTLVERYPHGRDFLLKLDKAWKRSKDEDIKEIWVPGALLARA